MNSYRRWSQAFLAALLLVLVAVVWILFAPVQLGGQVSYVIVNGISMEPKYHFSDLVILRQAGDYLVGDIVAYRDPTLGVFVFHRIIGTDLDHFILKGDNNSWTDSYRPIREELIGKLWLHAPKVGKLMQQIRNPLFMAFIAGSAGVILMTMPVKGKARNGKKMNKKTAREWFDAIKKSLYGFFVVKPRQSPLGEAFRKKNFKAIVFRKPSTDQAPVPLRDQQAKNRAQAIEGLFFVLGLLALASLVLGFFAFTRPLLHNVPNDIDYRHTGRFSYSAIAPLGVYDTGSITTGDPVFPGLTCMVDLSFDYALSGNQLQDLGGTYQLTATVLEEISNWRRTIPLAGQTAFSGKTVTIKTNLNMCQVESMVAEMEKRTGLNPVFYKLEVAAAIKISGTVGGQKLQDTFEPHLVFQFDKLHVYIFNNDETIDPLNPTQAGLIKSSRLAANTLPILGLKPEVSRMRSLSLVGAGVSIGGLLALGAWIFLLARRSQQSYMHMKYASMLVDVQSRSLDASATAIDVVTMDDLAKLAERNNAFILHETSGSIHYYFVQNDRITYRYTLTEPAGKSPEISQSQMVENMRLGIERGEFQVHYQPIVSITDGRIVALEALLRWQHPQRGLVNAREFILEAERTGLIEAIGEWMLKVALTQLKEWQTAGFDIQLAVNLSAQQLAKDPAEIISRLLQATGIDPQKLQIEVKESYVVENLPGVLPTLQNLKDLGVHLSLDNFTGQALLAAFGQIPFDSLKIDRFSIDKISDPENAASVGDIVTAGHEHGLSVVAEGVEIEEQLIFLRAQLCDLAQGYLLGRPAPAEEVTKLLQKGQPLEGEASS